MSHSLAKDHVIGSSKSSQNSRVSNGLGNISIDNDEASRFRADQNLPRAESHCCHKQDPVTNCDEEFDIDDFLLTRRTCSGNSESDSDWERVSSKYTFCFPPISLVKLHVAILNKTSCSLSTS